MKDIRTHFSIIAHKYRDLRTTDIQPILYIAQRLQNFSKIKAADIGCGCGRYDLVLFQHLSKDRFFLYCIDNNKEMLDQLSEYLKDHNINNFQIRRTIAGQLPLPSGSLDCLFTFNAIHHFPIFSFLTEVSRVLREGGYLFIYTRFKSQNKKSIWGKYFPLFNEKENRLYELNELENLLRAFHGFQIKKVKNFKYLRISSLNRLVEQARNHHYSTFYLYSEDEFKRSLSEFKRSITKQYKDLNRIRWLDRNALFVVRKEADNRVINESSGSKVY